MSKVLAFALMDIILPVQQINCWDLILLKNGGQNMLITTPPPPHPPMPHTHTLVLVGTWSCSQSAEGTISSPNFNKWAKSYWFCQFFNVITAASQHHFHLYLVWKSASWVLSSSPSLPDIEKSGKQFMSSEKEAYSKAAWSRSLVSFHCSTDMLSKNN